VPGRRTARLRGTSHAAAGATRGELVALSNRELTSHVPTNLPPLERFAQLFRAEQQAHDDFANVPVVVSYEDRRGATRSARIQSSSHGVRRRDACRAAVCSRSVAWEQLFASVGNIVAFCNGTPAKPINRRNAVVNAITGSWDHSDSRYRVNFHPPVIALGIFHEAPDHADV
jgi:hypothetical protein